MNEERSYYLLNNVRWTLLTFNNAVKSVWVRYAEQQMLISGIRLIDKTVD